MNWSQRLKRVFGIDIETCYQCGGVVKISASIDKSAGKLNHTVITFPEGGRHRESSERVCVTGDALVFYLEFYNKQLVIHEKCLIFLIH